MVDVTTIITKYTSSWLNTYFTTLANKRLYFPNNRTLQVTNNTGGINISQLLIYDFLFVIYRSREPRFRLPSFHRSIGEKWNGLRLKRNTFLRWPGRGKCKAVSHNPRISGSFSDNEHSQSNYGWRELAGYAILLHEKCRSILKRRSYLQLERTSFTQIALILSLCIL